MDYTLSNTSNTCMLKQDMSYISILVPNSKGNEAPSLVNTNLDFSKSLSINDKLLVKYPVVPYSIVVFYILFVVWIGPAIMKYRKPYSLQKVLIAYNFFQAVSNLHIAYLAISGILTHWNSRCHVRNNPNLPELLEEGAGTAYLLYLIKFADLLDTVFFVLRKKQRQVTFLHVFHHAGMCLLFPWGLKNMHHLPGFYMAVALAINTVVHTIMYTYYALASMGPKMQKYLWWKKHLTRLQIGQIFFILSYMIFGFLTGCEEYGELEFYTLVYVSITLILFLNFYRKYKN